VADPGCERHGDVFICEGRTSDGAESVITNEELVLDIQTIANGEKRLLLAVFGALSVADMHGGGIVVAGRQSRANAGIHASAEEDNCAGV
jgi:hypothetical protein